MSTLQLQHPFCWLIDSKEFFFFFFAVTWSCNRSIFNFQIKNRSIWKIDATSTPSEPMFFCSAILPVPYIINMFCLYGFCPIRDSVVHLSIYAPLWSIAGVSKLQGSWTFNGCAEGGILTDAACDQWDDGKLHLLKFPPLGSCWGSRSPEVGSLNTPDLGET